MYICEKCNKEFKTQQGLNSHMGWHNKPNRDSGFIGYNKKVKLGLIKKENTNQFTKAKNEGRKIIVSKETRFKIGKGNRGRIYSEKEKELMSIRMQKAVREHPDSYSASNVSGRTKTLEYNGKKLKGSWELLVAKWLDKNKINWTNEIQGIEYIWEGKNHLYFPDFYLIDLDKYVEVKGYKRERDDAKWKVLDNLIIIKKKEIEMIKKNIFKNKI